MSLTLVATPIGNLGDLSPRAEEALRQADFWIVEDSRVSGKLAAHFGIKKSMRVLNEHTSPGAIARYAAEVSVANACLLTDGGSPAISDPGALLCDRCHLDGIPVESIPGPSAPINALALSGFFAQRFAFLGFLGRKEGAIVKELSVFADSPYTLVLFESPHRIDALIAAAFKALGPRRYAICREMTKAYQQVYRANLPETPRDETVPRRGEFTLVIEGKRKVAVEVEESSGMPRLGEFE